VPEAIRVAVASGSVGALVYPASPSARAGITLILGHGAGAPQSSDFMVGFAEGLARRGADVVTFNFPYMEIGRRLPDRSEALEACFRAVIAAARAREDLAAGRLVIGGKSLGGRMASHLGAAGVDGLAGLVFLGYPLHPPGQPGKLRAAHLARIRQRMLFVQGSRDAFGTPDEVGAIIKNFHLPATLHVIEGAASSFSVRKSSSVPQPQVYETAMDEIAQWLRLR